MEKVKKFLSKIKFEKSSIFPAFFTAGSITLFTILLLSSYNLSSFNRIISIATASDLSISKLVFAIIAMLCIFIFTFGLTYVFFNHLRTKYSSRKDLSSFWQFFDRFSIIASVAIFIMLIGAFYIKNTTGKASIITPTLLILITYFTALILYLILNLKTKLKFNSYQKLILTILIIGFAICIAIPRLLPYINIVQIILCALSIIFVKFFKIKTELLDSAISGFMIIFSIFPIFLSIYIEVLNILNQHEIFITNSLFIYRIFFILFIIIASIASLIIYKNNFPVENWKKFVYPSLIIGIVMLSVQLPLTTTYDANIFESANYSVLISDFLNFGKVPIVEHYGGHMLSQFFGGIFYGLLNGDFVGAAYSPYAVYFNIIISIIAYFLIAKITDRDIAFFSIITLPFIIFSFSYFGLGIIIIFSLLHYFKKPNLKNGFLVDICLLLCALYRLDLGVAFGVSAIVTSIIYAIVKKKSLKNIIISSIIFAIIVVSIWFIICEAKGLDAFTQLKQFIAMSASNQNWAYPMFEKTSNFAFAWTYLILPLIMAFSLLYIIFTKARAKINSETWLILLVLGITYFANFSRSIVRHNIAELPALDASNVIFWTAYLYLSIFICTIKRNPSYFIPSYLSFLIFNFVIIGSSLANANLHTPLDNIPSRVTLTAADHKIERIHITPTVEPELSEIKTFITPFLDSDDTFFDFTNRSLIYSYLSKPDPIYAAQTPGHLNGDYTQEIAISDLSKNPVKLILMPAERDTYLSKTLDGIPNSLRYYKLSEYIYQNYVPLIGFNTGEVWITKDSYQDATKIAKDLCEKTSDSCIVLHQNTKPAETYNLANIPLLWGEKDTKDASSNRQLTAASKDDDCYLFKNNFDKTSGNYLKIIIDSKDTHEGKLALGSYSNSKFTENAIYTFSVKPGEHTYLFRVSHDEDWYNGNINAIKLSESNDNINDNIIILKGD